MDHLKNIGQVEYVEGWTRTYKLIEKVAYRLHRANRSNREWANWFAAQNTIAIHYCKVDNVDRAIMDDLGTIGGANPVMCLNDLAFNLLADKIVGLASSEKVSR